MGRRSKDGSACERTDAVRCGTADEELCVTDDEELCVARMTKNYVWTPFQYMYTPHIDTSTR